MSARKKVFFACAIFFTALIVRMFLESKQAYETGAREASQGAYQEAIVAFDRAAHAYFPGNPYTSKSLRALWSLGQDLEKKDVSLSLWAYDSIRGSVFGTASFYTPHSSWIPKVNDRIAHLRSELQAKGQPGVSKEELLTFHREMLSKGPTTHASWIWITELAFLAWIASVLGWIMRGHDALGVMNFRKSLPWMIALTLTFSIWIVGLTKA